MSIFKNILAKVTGRKQPRPWVDLHPAKVNALRLVALQAVGNGWVIGSKDVDQDEQDSELVGALFGYCGPMDQIKALLHSAAVQGGRRIVIDPIAWETAANAWIESLSPPFAADEYLEAGIELAAYTDRRAQLSLKLLADMGDRLNQKGLPA